MPQPEIIHRSTQLVLRASWNSLQVGDHVLVHDVDHPELQLLPGVVATVEATPGSNDIGVRVGGGVGARVLRPRRLTVHLEPKDLDEYCWRCARPAR